MTDRSKGLSEQQRVERVARAEFEFWTREGVKPIWYPLEQCANGEYVSPFTEYAWKAFFAGWNKNR